MSAIELPRRSLVWLLAAFVVVLLPHAPRLPPWVLLVVGIGCLWRYRVHQGRWNFAATSIKALLVLMSFLAVGLQYRTLNGLEPSVALLVIAGALKAMELRSTRDFLVVVFLGYFLAASQLLFQQEIYQAAYATFALGMMTAALIARHQQEAGGRGPNPLRLAGRMLLQALPLMLVLFVVFPRLSPLWSIPNKNTAAKTGPSDRMSPGDIARLSGSSELAFRVTFLGPTPARRELYWRGLVFSEFDGREWRPEGWARFESDLVARGARRLGTTRTAYEPGNVETEYEVILEPSNQPWAYALGYPLRFDETLRIGRDYRLIAGNPVSQRFRYRVLSDLAARPEPKLGELRRRSELQLPDGFNPRSLELARDWRAAAGSDREFIDRVLAWFNREAFVYTLEPPLLGRDSVDEFLFGTRRGFCEHYASAFVVLLRAAGIPARVVVGYQGGEQNPFEDYLLLHEYDAHAWAEAWLQGQGWVRFDPTAAVSPLRIESGLRDALGAEFLSGSPLAMDRYRNVPLLAWVSMRWDLLNYQWAQLVLQYDREQQFALLNRLLGAITPARVIAVLLACGGLVMLIVVISLFGIRPRTRRDAATALYLAFCERLAGIGITRRTGEGPLDFAQRAARTRPDLASTVLALTTEFVALGYSESDETARSSRLQRLRQQLAEFRPRASAAGH